MEILKNILIVIVILFASIGFSHTMANLEMLKKYPLPIFIIVIISNICIVICIVVSIMFFINQEEKANLVKYEIVKEQFYRQIK